MVASVAAQTINPLVTNVIVLCDTKNITVTPFLQINLPDNRRLAGERCDACDAGHNSRHFMRINAKYTPKSVSFHHLVLCEKLDFR
jgi:hypothetical protein